jgi:hypothetical protein
VNATSSLIRGLVLAPLLVLLGARWMPLEAQQGQNGVPGDDSSLTVRLGALTLGPSLVMTAARDTNILRTGEVERVSSAEYVAIPQFNLAYPVGHYGFSSAGAVEYTYTPGERSDKKTVLNNFIDVSFASSGTVFRPRARFERLSTYARSEIELGKKSQRNAQTIETALSWVPGRLSLEVGYSHLHTRFAADEFFRDVSLAEKLNFDFRTPSISVGYELSPILGLNASFDYTDNNFVLSPERNGRMYRTLGGVSFLAPGSLIGSVRAGVRTFQADDQPDVRAQALTVDAALTYIRSDSLVYGQYYRDVGFSWDASRAIFFTDQLGGRYYRELPKRLDFEVSGGMTWVNYLRRQASSLPRPRGQQRYTLIGALGVRLTRWTRVGVNVERDASSGNEQWGSWRSVSYLYYGSYRFRKLDRPLPR